MDRSFLIPVLLAALLGLLILVLLVKYLLLKKELRSFRDQINEIRTTNREQPITVASFRASTTSLASEINLLTEELTSRAKESAEEEKRLRQVMAGVSHDFRTPLTSADGYLQLVSEMLERILRRCNDSGADNNSKEGAAGKSGNDNQPAISKADTLPATQELTEIRDYLVIVSERIRYLKALSDEFFEVTYLDAGSDLPLEPVRFDTVLSEVMLSQYSWIETSGLSVTTEIPEEQLLVRADRHYLERILENLFSNARKYANSRLTVCAEKAADASSVTFRIQNDLQSGLSFEPERIFEPFYRSRERMGQGTGLGLYVCKELATAMHFTIAAEVEGGMFSIRLTMPT